MLYVKFLFPVPDSNLYHKSGIIDRSPCNVKAVPANITGTAFSQAFIGKKSTGFPLFLQFPHCINNGSVNPFDDGYRLIGNARPGWFSAYLFSLFFQFPDSFDR